MRYTVPPAVLEALAVVALWSSTPPLSKLVMASLPPFEFLAARYSIAFLALLPLVLARTWRQVRQLSPRAWLRLVIMGLLAYPLANGLQFWALARLPATTGTFTMNFVPLFTLALGLLWLHERPTRRQLWGGALALAGAAVFFGLEVRAEDVLPIAASSFGSFLLAINVVLARSLARGREIDSLGLAALPLGVGGGTLLLFTPPVADRLMPVIGMVLFLGVVSGSLAYTVWNHALEGLQAFELTVIGNLMPMGTALMALFLIGESIPLRGWLGIVVALVGVVLVALRGEAGRERVPGERASKPA